MTRLWVLLIACCVSAAAFPVISPPRHVSVPGRGKTGGSQSHPLIASSQHGFLLAWVHQDASFTDPSQPSRLLALRADTNGVPLDLSPIVVSESPSLIDGPVLASDGTNYVLAWLDSRGSNNYGLYLTRVTASGMVSMSNGFPINAMPAGNRPLQLTSGGEGSFLLWRDGISDLMRGARISSAGGVLDPSGLPVEQLPSTEGVFGSDGANHIFVSSRYEAGSGASPTVRWRIAQANGSVSDAAKIEDANAAADELALAFNGSRFLLITRHSESNLAYLLNDDGTLLGPGPVLRAGYRWHQIASSRGEFLVVSPSPSDGLEYLRYSGTGVLQASNSLALHLTPTAANNRFASSPHVSILFRWHANQELIASVIRPDGSIRNQFSPQGPNRQRLPSVASDGAGYLVAWNENRDGSNLVYAVRTDADGNAATAPVEGGEGSNAQTAYSSGIFLMVWDRNSSIMGRRLSRTGSWLDPAPVILQTNAYSPAVAGGTTNFLVSWEIQTNPPFGFIEYEVHAAIVGTNTLSSVNAPFEISNPGPRWQTSPKIAFNGSNYLVAWNAYQPSFFYSSVAGKFVSPSGQLLGDSRSTPFDSSNPLLTRHGDSIWLSWFHFSFNGNTPQHHRLAAVPPGGSQIIPENGQVLTISPEAIASVADRVWVGSTVTPGSPDPVRHVTLTSFMTPTNEGATFRFATDASNLALASNGTNLLMAYQSPALSSTNAATPRIYLRVLYPDTSLRVTQTGGLRLSGYARHPLVIDQSSDLLAWQPYRTNSIHGPFDYPTPAGPKHFFRVRWHGP